VQRHLFDAKEAVILTSATLRTEENFDYLRERLGAWDLDEAAVGSPFDYESSTLLYLPTDVPEPNNPGYQRTVESALIALVQATRGRTLVLFTSYSQLKNTANAIRERLADEDIVVFEQGSGGSRAQLLDNFKTAERSVLLGTRSFWEGIDVTGEKLSCVVITRLPFAVPNDPIFSARSETYEDAFNQYSVPDAILRFRQGFGRLIRTRTDRGVIVCLDRRILSKRYGPAFIRSLPKCTTLRNPLAHLPKLAARWIDEGHI
jgi:ATP-dependent DNA helicase DinG